MATEEREKRLTDDRADQNREQKAKEQDYAHTDEEAARGENAQKQRGVEDRAEQAQKGGKEEERKSSVTAEEEAASPEAWFDAQQDNHPVWRFVRQSLAGRPAAWDDVRTRSIERLRAWNEDPAAFRVVSRYLVITATRLA